MTIWSRPRRWNGGSLPVWEEWIEIAAEYERLQDCMSLPVWEEWIEIGRGPHRVPAAPSLPVWEEWIEMYLTTPCAPPAGRVSSSMGRVD